MVEYWYKWKEAAGVLRAMPPKPCPNCGDEELTVLIDKAPASAVPLRDTTYRKTVECTACGVTQDRDELTEAAFETFCRENDINRNDVSL